MKNFSSKKSFLTLLSLIFFIYTKASINHTDIIPDFSGIKGSSYAIDMNNDGTDDFILEMRNLGSGEGELLISGQNPNNFIITEFVNGSYSAGYYATNYSSGSIFFVGNSQSAKLFKKSIISNPFGSDGEDFIGPWFNDNSGFTNRYLGVQFDINGNTHYGWIKLDVYSANFTFNVKEYAYNEISDTPINAGQTCSAPYIIMSSISDTVIYEGKNVDFLIEATGNDISYQWQVNDGGGYINIIDDSIKYLGSTSNNLSIFLAQYDLNGNTYRCLINGACGSTITSNSSTLTVNRILPSFFQWCNDGVYGKQFSKDLPITNTNVYIVPKRILGAENYEVQISNDLTFTGSVVRTKYGTGETPTPAHFYFQNLPQNTQFWARVSVNGGPYGSTKRFSTHEVVSSTGISAFWFSRDGQYGTQYHNENPVTARTTHIVPRTKSGVSSYTVQIDTNSTFISNDSNWIITSNSPHYSNYQFRNLPASTTFYVRVMTDLDNNNWGVTRTFMTEGSAARPAAQPVNNKSVISTDSSIAYYNVYPNPFSDNLNLRVESKKEENLMITISDLTGKVVYESTKHQTNQTIQLGEDLIDGMYLIRLVHGDKSKLIKAVKK